MIKKAILYFSIITALLYGLRYLHYKLLLKDETGYYGKLKTAFLKKNNYTTIFLGSSRAEMHYDTQLFDQATGQNSFNLGIAGGPPEVAFAALKAYLLNSKAPNYLFYEVDYFRLQIRSSEIKEFNNYFPVLSNPELRNQFNNIDDRMNQFYYNPYYSWPYSGIKNLNTSFHILLNFPLKTNSIYYKGFLKGIENEEMEFAPVKKQHVYFNVSERIYLDSIILCCKQNHIKIALMTSPIFGGGNLDVANKKEILFQIRAIARIYEISYFDLSSLPFCNERSLFLNLHHMNSKGAQKFSPYLINVFNNNLADHTLILDQH